MAYMYMSHTRLRIGLFPILVDGGWLRNNESDPHGQYGIRGKADGTSGCLKKHAEVYLEMGQVWGLEEKTNTEWVMLSLPWEISLDVISFK